MGGLAPVAGALVVWARAKTFSGASAGNGDLRAHGAGALAFVLTMRIGRRARRDGQVAAGWIMVAMTVVTLSSRRLAELRTASLTYAAVGATRRDLPEGYHHVRRRAVVGAGPTQFRSAVGALMTWQMQLRSGVEVRASAPAVGVDEVADLRIGIGPVRVSAPVRVVHTIDEPAARGFAYGTLPGHPVTGEEEFVVELTPAGLVLVTITAFSRPAWRTARLAGPLGHAVQTWMTRRYLLALRPPLPGAAVPT